VTGTAFAFTCTKCGDCCRSGGPALSIAEIFKYQDVFITGLRWDCKAVPKNKHLFNFKGETAAARNLDKHFASFCPASFTDKDDTLHVHIYPLATGFYHERPCPALNAGEGTCTLHDDKPAMCRAVPFDTALPEELQAVVLRNFASAHDCMSKTPTAGANVIYRNGKITDTGCKADYDQRLAAMQKDQPLIGPLCYFVKPREEGLGSHLAPTHDELMQCASTGGWLETSMFGLLFVLLNSRDITLQMAESYLHSQIRLIEAGIADALERRRSNERERITIMRRYLEAYRTLLDDSGSIKPDIQQIKPAA
jgi:Fe-S-cluster containining protein